MTLKLIAVVHELGTQEAKVYLAPSFPEPVREIKYRWFSKDSTPIPEEWLGASLVEAESRGSGLFYKLGVG
jgi:hypothetical protein